MLRSFSLWSRRFWSRRFWSRRLLLLACTLVCALVFFDVACARRQRAGDVKYPPRRAGCGLQIVYADTPPVPAWDDIGMLEIICHIDDAEVTCFNRVRAEACRMGGNILYRLPRKIWRPREQVFGYRGMVAHTRAAPEHAPEIAVRGDGEVRSRWRFERADGWREAELDVPALDRSSIEITLTPLDADWVDHHVWALQEP